MENDALQNHCSDKDGNENWYEYKRLYSHYPLQIVIVSQSCTYPPLTDESST